MNVLFPALSYTGTEKIIENLRFKFSLIVNHSKFMAEISLFIYVRKKIFRTTGIAEHEYWGVKLLVTKSTIFERSLVSAEGGPRHPVPFHVSPCR